MTTKSQRRPGAKAIALEFHAIVPRTTPITPEPAIHFPLPAGRNPDDPDYGKVQLNPRDPRPRRHRQQARPAYGHRGLGPLDNRGLHNAWSNEAGPDRSTITYVEHNLAFFTRAMATLEAVDMPAEARSIIRSAVQAAVEIGVVGGNLQQALHARKDMPRAHTRCI